MHQLFPLLILTFLSFFVENVVALAEGFTYQIILFIPIVIVAIGCCISVNFLFFTLKFGFAACVSFLFVLVELTLLGIYIWFQVTDEYKDDGPFFIVNIIILMVWILLTVLCMIGSCQLCRRIPKYKFMAEKGMKEAEKQGKPIGNPEDLNSIKGLWKVAKSAKNQAEENGIPTMPSKH